MKHRETFLGVDEVVHMLCAIAGDGMGRMVLIAQCGARRDSLHYILTLDNLTGLPPAGPVTCMLCLAEEG